MAFAVVNYHSHSLAKSSSFHVVFPDDPALTTPWSTFYLLHGLSDDSTTWMRQTSIERYVHKLPMVVVMPDGGRGWFSNSQAPGGLAYEDDLLKDVMGLVERTFPVKAERAGRAIGGLSMGGFGAVKLGLKYPELFVSVSSHSGVLGCLHCEPEDTLEMSPEFRTIFGENAKDGPEDPFALAAKISRKKAPAMRLDCGEEDFTLDDNRAFHEHLNSLGITHEYEEFSGTHDWAYWDAHVREAVAFHARNLG